MQKVYVSENSLRIQPLPFHQFCKAPIQGNQLIVGAVLHNTPLLQVDDPVTGADGTQPVRNHNAGALQLFEGIRHGLLRDIMVNRTPIVLSKEIYATASLPGAIFYYFTPAIIGEVPSALITLVIIFAIRMWSIINKKNLPMVEKIIVD